LEIFRNIKINEMCSKDTLSFKDEGKVYEFNPIPKKYDKIKIDGKIIDDFSNS